MRRRDFCSTAVLGGAALTLPLPRVLAATAAEAPTILFDLPATRLSGQHTIVEKAALAELRDSLRGELILPAHENYEASRRVWNGMIDKRPAMIVRCEGAADVAQAVMFAREHDLLLAVRGGGHSYSGLSTCDGGMVIDLSAMRVVRVDPKARTATVAAGAWGRDVDTETQHYGLATTLGQISDTGVRGSDAADNERNRAIVRANWDKVAPFTEGFYTNLTDADKRSTDKNFGPNHAQLTTLKRKYDPGNLFRLNSNIQPGA